MSIAVYHNPGELKVKHSLNNVSEALLVLENRILKSELAIFDFVLNTTKKNYHFDFFSEKLQLGIQIDGYSYCYEETENHDDMKLVTISYLGVKVLKVSDYQVLIDVDEVIRFLKQEFVLKRSHKLIA